MFSCVHRKAREVYDIPDGGGRKRGSGLRPGVRNTASRPAVGVARAGTRRPRTAVGRTVVSKTTAPPNGVCGQRRKRMVRAALSYGASRTSAPATARFARFGAVR